MTIATKKIETPKHERQVSIMAASILHARPARPASGVFPSSSSSSSSSNLLEAAVPEIERIRESITYLVNSNGAIMQLLTHIIELMSDQNSSFSVTLCTLAPTKLKLKQPMFVRIASNGDDFIATFFDANISATGDTAGEALANLKETIAMKFNRFASLPETSLGKPIKRQLAVLREFIGE